MRKITTLVLLILITLTALSADDGVYPIVYIPGMFDNGDKETPKSLLVQQCNDPGGFYDQNYFTDEFSYDQEPLQCSSSIVGAKYRRLAVANTIGNYRTNISLWLMSDRFFCMMQGRAPRGKSWRRLTDYDGNDYEGTVVRDGVEIGYRGLIQEVWAKYGTLVFYEETDNGNQVTLLVPGGAKGKSSGSYENENGYFGHPDEIKFNFVVHSSGGIALRRYLQMCREEGLDLNVNSIVNLSVPQQGARMKYALKSSFPVLMETAMNRFWKTIESGQVTVKSDTEERTYLYTDLVKMTRVDILHGDSAGAKGLRKIVGDYILYNIPFDGRKRVLGTDPALWDLDPRHRLIKKLAKEPLPEGIPIHNFRVHQAYAVMFQELGQFLKLDKNDGVVDYRDAGLDHLPNYNDLWIITHDVEKANHIPFPYVQPIYELHATVDKFYGFLKILLKKRMPRAEGVFVLQGMLVAIMQEFGLDLEYLLEHEDYSVIDYFAEHPARFYEDK